MTKPKPKKAAPVKLFKRTPKPEPVPVVLELTPAERLAAELRDPHRKFDDRYFLHPGTINDFLAEHPEAKQ